MKKVFFAVLALFTLFVAVGCEPNAGANMPQRPNREGRNEPSQSYFEQAKVCDLIYTPPSHYAQNSTRTEKKTYYDWHAGEFKQTLVPVTDTRLVEVQADYTVIFECEEHKQKFVVHGSDERHKQLWSALKKDMDVIVEYKEIWRSVYENGVRDEAIKPTLVKYDFIDAKPGILKVSPESDEPPK